MKKILFTFVLTAFALAAFAQEPDRLYVEDFIIEPGQELEVAVKLATPSGCKYMQAACNIFLPEGLSFVQAYSTRTKKNYVRIDAANAEGLQVIANDIAASEELAGSLGLAVGGNETFYDANNSDETHIDVPIFYITVKADENVKACGMMRLVNITLTEVGYVSHNPEVAGVAVTAPASLADVIEDGIEDKPCIVNEALTCVYADVNSNTLYCKDDNGYRDKAVAQDDEVDFIRENARLLNKEDWDQSNWVAIALPEALTASHNYVGKKLTGIAGTLTDKVNPAIAATAMPTAGDDDPYTLNTYIPCNFHESSVQTSAVTGEKYFFMPPKPMEIAMVTWAIWNSENSAFVFLAQGEKLENGQTTNLDGLVGGMAAEFGLNAEGEVARSGEAYQFTALVTVARDDDDSTPAPARRVLAGDASHINRHMVVYPLNLDDNGIVTSVNEMGSKVIAGIDYYDVNGVKLTEPKSGVNIVVTTYTDGTRTTVKVVK